MGRYEIVIRKSAARDLQRIPNRDLGRILAAIDDLSDQPRLPGVEKLPDQERYRVRQGSYRVIYEIRGADVIVVAVKVGHPRDVYRRN